METRNGDSKIMKSRGQLTAKMAREISPYWEKRGYFVLYDHDPSSKNVGKIVSSFGKRPYGQSTQLSHIDIAIVEKSSDRVFALIEIEETTDKPKSLLGDVFGILMGEYISFGKERPLSVDEHTALFVSGKSKVSHKERIDYILDKVKRFSSNLGTRNSKIEKIDMKTFFTEHELKELLTNNIPSSLSERQGR
jgi:hypothetical protein